MIQTQTIDIEHVQKILANCPNYDYIVNYDFDYGDELSSRLIDWYREIVFSADGNNPKQLEIVREIDKSLYLYVQDNKYKKGLKKLVNIEDITLENQGLVMELIKKIIMFTKTYENKKILEIGHSKWL